MSTEQPVVRMNAAAMRRHLPLPAGVDKATGELLTLAECLAEPGRAADLTGLPLDRRIALVKARWLAGEWRDVHVMPGGFVNRDRALREVGAQTELGRKLLEIGLSAVTLVHRHAGPVEEEG